MSDWSFGISRFFRALTGVSMKRIAAAPTAAIGQFRESLAFPNFLCKTGATAATIPTRRAKSAICQGSKTRRPMTGPEKNRPDAIDWEQALTENSDWMRAVIANRLGGGDRQNGVDEVMQEVALAAVKSPAGSVTPEKVGPWLYQVAVRQTMLHRRKAGRRRKLVNNFAERKSAAQPTNASLRGNANESSQPDGDPLIWILAVERAEQIRTAIGNLHRRDREMLILKYEQGWSYHQLAEHLDISHSATEARLHRARKRLRQELLRMQLVEENS